ncbi:hypothetical protein ACOME3_005240, partial [Neoechinorhynchus agilis]
MSAFITLQHLMLIIAVVLGLCTFVSSFEDRCHCIGKCHEKYITWQRVDQTRETFEACYRACEKKCRGSKDGNVDFTAEPALYNFGVDEF